MAPRVPKSVASEIFDILNESIGSGSSLHELQLQSLIRKAGSLRAPERYACLTALYSHAFKPEQAYESAVSCIQSINADESCIVNTFSALTNGRLFQKIVDISKKNPFTLEYSQSRQDTYDAALYILDLEHCDSIVSNYQFPESDDVLPHKKLLQFFENDAELISRASSYIVYVLDSLSDVLRDYSIRSKSLTFGLVQLGFYSSLNFVVSVNAQCIDTVFEMESDWLKKIARYTITDEKLCDVAFSFEVES